MPWIQFCISEVVRTLIGQTFALKPAFWPPGYLQSNIKKQMYLHEAH